MMEEIPIHRFVFFCVRWDILGSQVSIEWIRVYRLIERLENIQKVPYMWYHIWCIYWVFPFRFTCHCLSSKSGHRSKKNGIHFIRKWSSNAKCKKRPVVHLNKWLKQQSWLNFVNEKKLDLSTWIGSSKSWTTMSLTTPKWPSSPPRFQGKRKKFSRGYG